MDILIMVQDQEISRYPIPEVIFNITATWQMKARGRELIAARYLDYIKQKTEKYTGSRVSYWISAPSKMQ